MNIRWLREISQSTIKTQTKKPNSVLLAALLQATRGMLLIVFNWMTIVEFERRPHVPGLDVMALAPPSIFFLIGALDLLTVKWVWKRSVNGWRYGIVLSTLITLMTPYAFVFLIYVTSYLMGLYLVIDLFAATEVLALLTLDARRFHRAKWVP